MKTPRIVATALTVGAFALASCTPTQQTYGLGGAAAGAAAGALVGGDSDDIIKGAALGGAAGTGYAVFRENQDKKRNVGYNQPPQPQVTPPAPTPDYPTGYATDTPGIVVSPYKPHNKVNVKGFQPGTLAKDPTTGKIFVVPN